MSVTLIQSFRHLEHQNPSISLEDICRINIGCKICDGRNKDGWNTEHGTTPVLYWIESETLPSIDCVVL